MTVPINKGYRSYSVEQIDLSNAGKRRLPVAGEVLSLAPQGRQSYAVKCRFINERQAVSDINKYPQINIPSGSQVRTSFEQLEVEWDAQPGVIATFIISQDPEANFDFSAVVDISGGVEVNSFAPAVTNLLKPADVLEGAIALQQRLNASLPVAQRVEPLYVGGVSSESFFGSGGFTVGSEKEYNGVIVFGNQDNSVWDIPAGKTRVIQGMELVVFPHFSVSVPNQIARNERWTMTQLQVRFLVGDSSTTGYEVIPVKKAFFTGAKEQLLSPDNASKDVPANGLRLLFDTFELSRVSIPGAVRAGRVGGSVEFTVRNESSGSDDSIRFGSIDGKFSFYYWDFPSSRFPA